MKMSDAFELPVKATTELRGIQNCIFSGEDKLLAATSEIDLATPIAHAVNCHDELVEALSEMVNEMQCLIGAHTQMIGGLDDDSSALVAYNKAKTILEKAK